MGTFEKLVRFFCACAPGIAVGLWLASQLGFWWPLGALVGAVVSYVLIEWKVAVLAIPKAYSRATSWQPDKELWYYRRLAILGFLSITSSCVVLSLGTLWLDSYVGPSGFFSNIAVYAIPKKILFFVVMINSGIAFASFITACLWLFAMLSLEIKRDSTTGVFQNYEFSKMVREAIEFGNPLAVFFYWPAVGLGNLPKIAAWFFRNVVWKILLFCGRFLKQFVSIIHSRKRTLCATTTFITVVIGYAVDGDLVTFTIAGAIIGALYSVSPLRDWVVVKTQSQPQLVSV